METEVKLTNKAGLPGAIIEAIKNDDYTPGESDISVTQLINPPRIRVLKKRHSDEIVEDASNMIFALLGTAVHAILERSEPTALVENRLYLDIDGWKLGGQYDRMSIRQVTLQDYKVCSVWESIYGIKPDRIAQLNVLKYIAMHNGHNNLKKLEVVAIFRDWQKSKAKYDKKYPQHQVQRIPVEVWDREKTLTYVKERINTHRMAESVLPECTKEERWATDDKFAVMKKGRKSAVRLLDDEMDAAAMAIAKGTDHYLEIRPGTNKRCDDYCNVAPFCTQYEKLNSGNE